MIKQNIFKNWSKRFLSTFNFSETTECGEAKNLILERHGPVAMIGINKQEKKNALDEDLINQLNEAIDDFERNDDLLAGVIFGEGGNFCAGYDLKEIADKDTLPKHVIHNKLTERYIKKPVVAAISGYAVGTGFDLALWCDLRVMEETAVVGCFGRRFGMSMSDCGIGRLQSVLGFSRAMDLLLTGRAMRSEEAMQCGLANRIVPCGTAVGQSFSLAHSITKFPQAGVLKDRALLCKQRFLNFGLKNIIKDDDPVLNSENISEDIKKGAELFVKGHGKKGNLFSRFLWKDVEMGSS